MEFITDYCRLYHKLVRNPFTLPIIGKPMQNLEGFQYATALDMNMGYCTIWISPTSQDMTTIITEFCYLRYNWLPMGMCASGDILQSKVDKILSDIDGVKLISII